MPAWFLDPQFDALAGYLFAILLAYGVVFLIKAIAAVLPTINLYIGKIDFGKLFTEATQGIVNWLVGYAQSRAAYIAAWLHTIAADLTSLFDSTIGSLYAHASQIQWLQNHGIPNAARAAVNTAIAHSAFQLQLVRTEIHAAQVKWENAHSYADAVEYVNLERTAPSVEHAFLAGLGRTLIASENHAQDLHDQLRDYIGKHVTGQADVAKPYTGQTLTGVAGAIAIPGPIDLSNVDVQDIIKTGSQIAIGTAVAVIATKIVECLVSNCAGNNNFQNLLNDALGLLGAAEFAEFLNTVVHNPGSVVTGFESDVQKFIPAITQGPEDVWSAIESALGL